MSGGVVAFVLSSTVDWKKSTVEDWDLDYIELDGSEKVVGHRQLDGSICKIVQTAEGKYFALNKKDK